MAKKDYLNIHFMRIFACILVVIIHITATPATVLTPNSIPQLFFLLINQISKAAVPIFVFISGFILSKIYEKQKINPLSFWPMRLPKLVFPYILWSLAYYFIYVYKGFYPLDLTFILKGLLYGTFVYHLYFMIIIIQCYLLFPFLHMMAERIGYLKCFIISAIFQMAFVGVLFPYKDRFITSYIVYFTFGMLIAKRESNKSPSLIKLFLSATSWVFIGFISFTLELAGRNQWVDWSWVVYSIAFIILSLLSIAVLYRFFDEIINKIKVSPSLLGHVKNLSQGTQLIYYAHPLVIFGTDVLLNRIGLYSISLRALIYFMVILLFLFPFATYLKPFLKKIKRPTP